MKPDEPLPSLKFGVATSDHQAEAFDASRMDIRDKWERSRNQTLRGNATDFWNRYEEDIKLAAGLGCRIFRFSISWARVEPEPGNFDRAALEHYHDVVSAIRKTGMQPVITLHHFTWPIHVEERGGLIAPDFPRWFAAYANEVAAAMGAGVPYWITFNEPNLLVYGYIKPWWQSDYAMPPGCPAGVGVSEQLDKAMQLMRNLFSAHTLARDEIRKHDPVAKVGANPFVLGLPGWLLTLQDWLASATRSRIQFRIRHEGILRRGWLGDTLSRLRKGKHPLSKFPPIRRLAPVFGFFDDLFRSFAVLAAITNTDWWTLGMRGKLSPLLCPESCHGKQDFAGFDYYWGASHLEPQRVAQLLDATMSKFANAPVDPPGLLRALRRRHRFFPGQEILIVENGCIESADGFDRTEYIKAHVEKMREARREGIPVAAYICWSITSNREWGLSFSPDSDFGLYHIDLDTDPSLARRRTKSADVYAALIREDAIKHKATSPKIHA